MKQVLKVLGVAVGFLLSATLIILSITYFNRGKSVVTENAEGVLALIENSSVGNTNLKTYDGMDVQGSIVISMVESLSTDKSPVPILVFTSKGAVVSEYTKAGATKEFSRSSLNDKDPYKLVPNWQTGIVSDRTIFASGDYKQKNSTAYINPTQTYSVTCHYTSNEALAFITIVHKGN